MPTEKAKILTHIRERITSYFDTDDNRMDDDFIWAQIILMRPIFIERMFEDNARIPDEFFSRITMDVDVYHETTNIDLPGYTRSDIPPLIKVKGNIRYLGSPDLTKEYTRVGFDGFRANAGREWTAAEVFYLAFKGLFYLTRDRFTL